MTFKVVHRTSTVLLINWNLNILFVRTIFMARAYISIHSFTGNYVWKKYMSE